MTPTPKQIEAATKAVADNLDVELDGGSPSEFAAILAQAALTAFLQSLADDGMVVVPKEPTEAMIKFALDAIQASWEGCGLDGGYIQEHAEKLGLTVREVFDPEKHTDWSGTLDPGDDIFVLSDELMQVLNENKTGGACE